MRNIRSQLNKVERIKNFDRVVFKSIVEKIIVGETNVVSSHGPYKLFFRGINNRAVPDAED